MSEEKNIDDFNKPNGWHLDRPDKMNRDRVNESLNSTINAYNSKKESDYDIPGFYVRLGDDFKQVAIVIDLEANAYLPLLHRNKAYIDSAVDFLRKHREG